MKTPPAQILSKIKLTTAIMNDIHLLNSVQFDGRINSFSDLGVLNV